MADDAPASLPTVPVPPGSDPAPTVTTITAGTAPADLPATAESPPPPPRARYEPNRVEIAG